MPGFLLLCFLLPLALSGLLTAGLIRWAPRLGLVDLPSARKVHTRPTPRAGGLAFFAAFAATAWLLPLFLPALRGQGGWLDPLDPRWLAAAVIFLLGLADDLRPLPWQLRLGVQTAAAATALLLVAPAPASLPAWLYYPAALVWLVGLINACNMLDNMDALAGGVAWIATACLAAALVLGPGQGNLLAAAPCLMLLGGLAGFLVFNRPPARIFMGDAGSTFLGFFVGLAGLEAGRADTPPWAWVAALAFCAVPWYDLVTVVGLRLLQGRSPFQADRQHLSHRLVARGLEPAWAVAVIHLLALASGGAGLLLYAVASWPVAALVLLAMAFGWTVLATLDLGGWSAVDH